MRNNRWGDCDMDFSAGILDLAALCVWILLWAAVTRIIVYLIGLITDRGQK